ncbi:MAG: glycine zipper 2TM domain-containing protein [Burkholderiales bacterium]|nr:glycine zipper 2TM domain-containing protein [Burkholderiales bacterium]
MKRPFTAAAAIAALALLSACATSDPDVVSRYDAQRMSSVVDAVVISTRPVVVDGSQSGLGGTAGGVVGAVAGSGVGGYRDSAVGAVLGAVLGGVIGNAVERSSTREQAQEIVVQLRNGERRAIVQALGSQGFRVGDPVVLITTGGKVRVERAPAIRPGAAG